MVAEEGSSGVSEGRKRGSQAIRRERERRRRPNIEGPRHTIEVVFSESEWAKVQQRAARADCTVPWFVVQCATDTLPAAGKGAPRPARLPLATFNAVMTELMEASGAMDEVRLQELSKIGGNINQIAHAANITGFVAEEVSETLAELRETMAELREGAKLIVDLAAQVARR